MRLAATIAAAALAAAALTAPSSATAAPIEHGKFHDVETDVFTCESNGLPVGVVDDISGSFLLNQRGSSAFPYYRESVHGTTTWTNLNNGGTFTNVFTSNSRDHTIVDNGDGTITITSFRSGGSRFYDADGKLVLRDPGQVRVAFDVDYNGTPGNPDDDIEIPGSFRIVRPSTGNSDFSQRDFCADLAEFTG